MRSLILCLAASLLVTADAWAMRPVRTLPNHSLQIASVSRGHVVAAKGAKAKVTSRLARIGLSTPGRDGYCLERVRRAIERYKGLEEKEFYTRYWREGSRRWAKYSTPALLRTGLFSYVGATRSAAQPGDCVVYAPGTSRPQGHVEFIRVRAAYPGRVIAVLRPTS